MSVFGRTTMSVLLLACAKPDPCEPRTGTEACPIHACVSTCSDPGEALQCCAETFGSTTVDSSEHAICAAQAQGMEPGLRACQTKPLRGAHWEVRTTTEDLPQHCHIGGLEHQILVQNGALRDVTQWTATTRCR